MGTQDFKGKFSHVPIFAIEAKFYNRCNKLKNMALLFIFFYLFFYQRQFKNLTPVVIRNFLFINKEIIV